MDSRVSPPFATSNGSLTLNGNAGYFLHSDNRVTLTLDAIHNKRSADNISGTLAIQFRAYSQCSGASFVTDKANNWLLASTTIGELTGDHALLDCQYDLLYQSPPAGLWKLAIELREWDGSDYVLCDAVEFANLHRQEGQVERHEAELETDGLETAPHEDDSTKHESVETVAVTTATAVIETSEKAQEKTATEKTTQDITLINKAKASQLTTIKGISKALCKRIIEERPFSSITAILKLKGMGPKLLQRIIDALKG